jgi:hypothetical protein
MQQTVIALSLQSLTFSTQSDVPETKPSASNSTPVAYQQAITFFWQPAPRIACSVQNGLYDGFHLELWGDDEWVHSNSPINTYELEENVQQFYVQKLLSFTRYTLKVSRLKSHVSMVNASRMFVVNITCDMMLVRYNVGNLIYYKTNYIE